MLTSVLPLKKVLALDAA
jgi:hypothetical protein